MFRGRELEHSDEMDMARGRRILDPSFDVFAYV